MSYKDPAKQKAYLAEHYAANRNTYAARSQVARQKRYEKLNQLKDGPCADCKQSFHPAVMHFHHLDPSTKLGTIGGEAMNRWGWQRIVDEAAKCVLLCSNCHIMRHVNART